MKLSATQAATGALTAAVVAGLLLLPGQLLGTDSVDRTVITLPVTTAPAPVHAALIVTRKPARRRAAAAQPQPARATAPVSAPVRVTPLVHRVTATPRRRTTVRAALVARIVRSTAVRSALTGRRPAPATKKIEPQPVSPPPTTTTAAQPTIVASVEQPAPPPTDGLRQELAGRPHGGDGGHRHDHGANPWDGGFGGHGHGRGR